MCGIAGAIGGAQEPMVGLVGRMLDLMIHRGPDQGGVWRGTDFGPVYGHRRLSILDLSEAGRQPMEDRETGVVLCYNGECYNYVEIKTELLALGHQFRSRSDTEVLLRAYIEYGVQFLEKLRGMYAFAIWDPRIQETLLVRDPLGIKPLYYSSENGKFVFASELRALLGVKQAPHRLNPTAISAFLWHGFVPGPDTMVQNIFRLDSGTYLRINVAGQVLERSRFWTLPGSSNGASQPEAVEHSRSLLTRSISEHLVSDVPLGVFLSGGVDSSVVAALAQRGSDATINTYNIRFEEKGFDESQYARKVANSLCTNHSELTLTESMFEEGLEAALATLDQPSFDAINTYFVSREVKKAGLTVALAGTGGDELFGGYSSFSQLPLASSFANLGRVIPPGSATFLTTTILDLLSRKPSEVRSQVRWGKMADVLRTKGDLVSLYQVFYAMFTRDYWESLQNVEQSGSDFGLTPRVSQYLRDGMRGDAGVLERISRLELFSFLGERLLPDTDAASMGVSLEVRVPLLDHKFIESLAMLTTDKRYEPIGKKQFLRDMVKQDFDTKIFERPKAGFELPMQKWCASRLAPALEATFSDINLALSIGLNPETISRIWRSFKKGAPGLHWSRIWALYVLMNWCKKYRVTIA